MPFDESSRVPVLSAVASSSGSLDRPVYTMDCRNRGWPSEGKKLWKRTHGQGAIRRFIHLVDLLPGKQAEWTLDREPTTPPYAPTQVRSRPAQGSLRNMAVHCPWP